MMKMMRDRSPEVPTLPLAPAFPPEPQGPLMAPGGRKLPKASRRDFSRRPYSRFHHKRRGGATPADGLKSTPVAGNRRAPKALQPPSRRADETRLTPVVGVPPHAY